MGWRGCQSHYSRLKREEETRDSCRDAAELRGGWEGLRGQSLAPPIYLTRSRVPYVEVSGYKISVRRRAWDCTLRPRWDWGGANSQDPSEHCALELTWFRMLTSDKLWTETPTPPLA